MVSVSHVRHATPRGEPRTELVDDFLDQDILAAWRQGNRLPIWDSYRNALPLPLLRVLFRQCLNGGQVGLDSFFPYAGIPSLQQLQQATLDLIHGVAAVSGSVRPIGILDDQSSI